MGRRRQDTSETRFSAYVDGLISVIGHADRARPLRDYCTGLLMPCERKSVEPMAAVTAPERTAAQHQSLLHFVGEGRWSDERVLAEVREMVLPVIERGGPIEAWIIDDTAFPKKGTHSVGVARQYCGQLGKQDNCQVAASLSVANHHASLPVAYRLYLPEAWASNVARRKKVGVPDQIVFQTKIEIARRDAKHRPIKVKDLALRPGGLSLGARERTCPSNPALRECAFALHGATSTAASLGQKNGC
jgi:SRSO17 transposase